jgi:hypothetical protein
MNPTMLHFKLCRFQILTPSVDGIGDQSAVNLRVNARCNPNEVIIIWDARVDGGNVTVKQMVPRQRVLTWMRPLYGWNDPLPDASSRWLSRRVKLCGIDPVQWYTRLGMDRSNAFIECKPMSVVIFGP